MALTRIYRITCFMVLSLSLVGCYRQASVNTAMIFQGRVTAGHLGQDASGASIVIVDGPQQNATVSCDGYTASATTASDGSYSLTVHAVRRFTGPNSDSYVLTADAKNGNSEKITIAGSPGDVIAVRTFILYKHPEE